VLTNILDVQAPKGSIGTSADPLNADLVQSEDANGILRPIQDTVLAGGNAYLNFTGYLRDPNFDLGTTPFIVPLGSIQAGGDIFVSLQESVQQSAPGTSIGAILVFEPLALPLPRYTTVSTYFRPGTGTGPAESSDPGFDDSNSTLIDSTYNFASLTADGNIQLSGIPTSTTEHGELVTPVINISGFTNINPTATSTGQISASTNGDITITETVGAMRVGVIQSTGGNVLLTVPNNATSGDDFTMANGSTVIASKGEVTIDVADNVTLAVGSSIRAALTALIQGDFGEIAGLIGSIINIAGQIFAPIADIDGGLDSDVISLTNVPVGTVMTITTGSGVNTVNIGSIAPPEPNKGVLNNIQGPLTIKGNGSDTLNADATGDTAAQTGTLTATTLTGLNMGSSGIACRGLANLNINLGSGGNTFLISNTAAVTNTFLNSGRGADTVNINATSGPTTVNTGSGTKHNTINVGSLEPATGGMVNFIQGALIVEGNGADTMNVDDTGATAAKTATLTATTLTGMSMGASGITYNGLAKLNIDLGKAADQVDVKSSASGTTSTFVTQATGNTWNVGSKAPTLTGGVLAGIQGPVVIDGGGSSTDLTDTINFDDSGSTNPSEYGVLTDDSLTKLGMGSGGVTFVGQAILNIKLGNNGTVLQGFIANNLPATTNIAGGSSTSDSFISGWDHDFNGTLNLSHIGDAELDVSGQFYGHLNATSPAYIDSLVVGGSVNAGSSISAQQIDSLYIGVNLDINLSLSGIAGAPAGTDALGNATIGGSLPEKITLTAASIGSLAVGTNGALAAGSHNLAGIVDVTPGNLGTLTVGPDGSITTTAQVNVAGNLDTMTMLGATPNVGQVMAGVIDVGGTLGSATIAGGTPGLFEAGQVGTIGAYGGFGPVVLRVIEAGTQRWLEEDPAGEVFSQPDAAATATTSQKYNYINTQFFYESDGFSSPQISARITNGVSSSPDQFDLSTVVFQDGKSFNLDRLDAAGVAGIGNVAVEGSLVTTLSAAAQGFFLMPSGSPDPSPAGVYLPADDLASVSVRDHAPNGSIVAAEIQGVAFGSFTSNGGTIEPGSQAATTDASRLLGPGTMIVPAGSVNGQGTETFRVPFAALPVQQVAFFLDTASGAGTFDPKNMVFTLESDSDGIDPATLFPATRGAVTAVIGVDAAPQGSVVQSVDLYGDGGSILSEQFIAQSITSTGPLGDLTVLAPQGLNNVTAPSIFGNISAAGPLFGTIQTTGVRTDPVTGATSEIPADLGRVYVVQPGGRNAQPYVTATTIGGQGTESFTGRIISRGNLISSIRSDDGASGLVAAQGNFGAMTSLLGSPTRVGGLLVNGGFSGQLVVLGNDYGDLTFHGGLTGGRIAVKGTGGAQSGILGNVIIDRGLYPNGSIGAGSAIVSGGEIGDTSLGTALSVTDNNDGIVAAMGQIRLSNGPLGGYVFNDVGATAGNPNAAAIDAIFTDDGQPLGIDLPNQPLGGLAQILEDLAALYVDPENGDLAD
jgi:hypothetical protein